ncbi:MoeA domain protein domain IV [Caldalkalibacillus thermarum TA2.A1]|uniref:Molybdopterin molybdenumtransferase n=1 Tax=Caldalkalibacillus thermarum (strain TA2.A1) TaxID=986075 RepID=F5L5T8_CALTT|nr:MoeA domain protein domain IV [Caldalkalibacillus thermarum]EGL83293.1 MoeA domain protein domain IV [Caldalkalibacillus thermarum TA2.A1]QZT33209.1 hypothetical protein HUR95_13015 [Caldalkalibacillus thermarum TA2.A1]
MLFDKVAMRPGSVTTVAQIGSKWIFGLSGNPSACFVGFELFTRPVLRCALGATAHPHLPRSKAVLVHDIPNNKRITRLMRGLLEVRGSRVLASTVGVDKSGVASSLVQANGLLIIPGTGQPLHAGEEIEVMWLERPDEGHFYV